MSSKNRFEEIHGAAVVVDTHCDRIMTLMPEERRLGSPPPEPGTSMREHLDLLETGGVDCQIWAVYIEPIYHPIALRKTLQMIDVFHEEALKLGDRIAVCLSHHEIMETVGQGKHAAVLAVEGGESLMGDLRMINVFHKLGVRSMGLTHFPRNKLADGSAEMGSDSGLSSFGISIVEAMNDLNMVVDVSHINERGFWQVLELSKAPIIASHSNCKALCDHHRNLTDDQIRALGDKGGTMGITYVAPFLEKMEDPMDFSSRSSSVDKVLDHIDHAVELIGSEHVNLGSDYNGAGPTKIRGIEDISKTPNITKGLVERGYSDKDIKNILGSSFLRVFKEVLG
jgi:membrane dipeptidase